jgi:hypothetical protein
MGIPKLMYVFFSLMKTPLPTEDCHPSGSTPQITTDAKEKMRLEELVSYR